MGKKSAEEAADQLEEYCRKHINERNEEPRRLYRIFTVIARPVLQLSQMSLRGLSSGQRRVLSSNGTCCSETHLRQSENLLFGWVN